MARRMFVTALALCLGAAALRGESPASPAVSLVLTYKCPPGNRPAFREHMATVGAARFQKWKADELFRDYEVLFSSFVNAAGWDMMVFLHFDSPADLARWREIEKRSPGGLGTEGLRLASPVTTYLAELGWAGTDARRVVDRSVSLVIPYVYKARGEYRRYVDGYVIPQLQGWMREGIVSGYGLYLNQFEAGPPWDSLLVVEYRDDAALGQRRAVLEKVRASLKDDAAWKALNDRKQDIRTEGEVVIADPILPR